MNEDWRRAAEEFYDREAVAKAGPDRRRIFVDAYRRVAARLGLAAGARLLDAGCGCGELASALAGTGIRYAGADLSPASLKVARASCSGAGSRMGCDPGSAAFLAADLARLPFRNGAFDGVAAITSVEFCPDRVGALRELARVLRPGGKLYLDVRNRGFLLFRMPRPWLDRLGKLGVLEPYPVRGFGDLDGAEWESAAARGGLHVVSRHASLWPWNFGSPINRAKNMVILAVRLAAPLRFHYMLGLVLAKEPDGKAA